MKKLCLFFIVFVALTSCRKDSIPIPSPQPTPTPPTTPAAASEIKVTINDERMQVDTFNYSRGGNSLDIEAINSTQRVALEVRNFYQTNAFSYICPHQVLYATRDETGSDWEDHPIPNTNYRLELYDWMPMKDSIVSGYFTASLSEDKKPLEIRANFKLVFRK